MIPFVQGLVTSAVWLLANAVYIDMRRRGARGFGRFAAFWVGFPVTFIWKAVVKEGADARVQPPEDDEDDLLREVQLDRERRTLRETGE